MTVPSSSSLFVDLKNWSSKARTVGLGNGKNTARIDQRVSWRKKEEPKEEEGDEEESVGIGGGGGGRGGGGEGEGEIEEQYLTCSICYDVFTEPKTLVCLHRFCERCLQGYLVGLSEKAVRKKSFPCPVCRELNPAPDPRRPAADWACLLRTDFHLKSLIKALKAGQKNSRAATTSSPSESATRGGRVKNPCTEHSDKEQDLYCVDCRRSICHLCAGISHRGCSQVITLAEAAADRKATLDLHCQSLTERMRHLAQLRAQIDSAVDRLGDQRRKAEVSIRQSSEAAVAAVRLQEKEQLSELTSTLTLIHQDLDKRLTILDNKMDHCQQVLDSVRQKTKCASDGDMIHQASALINDSSLLDIDESKVRNILLRLKDLRLEFQPSPNRGMIRLGELSLSFAAAQKDEHAPSPSRTITPNTPTPTPPPPRNTIPRHNRPPPPPVPPKRPRSKTLGATTGTTSLAVSPARAPPVKVGWIPGRFREDQHSPKLRDVLVLSGMKTVLVTDWANQCVKAFHERKERSSRLGVGGKPWCLARVTDCAVAVSLPVSSQICVLKVTPRLALQSSFFAQKRYSGLAALNSDTLVASGGSDPPCVDLINLGGEVLRTFSHDVTTGQPLFLYPAYLTMMADRKHFLVSDRRRNALVCLNVSGRVCFILQPEGSKALQEPSGVRTDKLGGVYLAEARGVVNISNEGVLDRVLLRGSSEEDGLEDPRGLDLDEEGGLMYITSREQGVMVFKVS